MGRLLRTTVILCCLSGLSWARPQEENWAEFRGPSGAGHSNASGLPREWGESKNIVWKTPIHGLGWSSPVVWDDQVWLTTATPDGTEYYAICVDRKSGKIQVNRRLFQVSDPNKLWRKYNSYASPTPVIEKGRVYVTFGATGTACLDTRSGKTVWTRRDLPCDHFRGAGSSPILFRNLLIMHFDGFDHQYVVALDKKTGKTVWKTDRSHDYGTDNGDFKKAFATPTVINVGGMAQLISPAAKATLAYDPLTGKELWRIRYPHHSTAARPVFGNGRVYINTGFGKAQLIAVRPDGKGDVTDSHVVWKTSRGIGSKPSPVLVGDLIYTVADQGGVAICIDAQNGREVWKRRIAGKMHSASPVHADGVVYFFGEDGTTVMVKPGREFAALGENKLEAGGRCMATPAIAGKSIFLRTGSHLYRIEKR